MARASVPANVAGEFYVEEGCCTMCGVPFVSGRALFDSETNREGYEQCFVKRQPADEDELQVMVEVMNRAELQCIRYRGTDAKVLARLIAAGEHSQCDHAPPLLAKRWWQLWKWQLWKFQLWQ